MPKYEIVHATDDHAQELAGNMRRADVEEAWAAARLRPLEAIRLSMVVSRDTRAGLVNGRVVCLYGVGTPTLMGVAIPWMAATEELKAHSRVFLRMSRGYVRAARSEHSYMLNYVDARNKESLRWLRWLGFSLLPPIPFGPDQLPFHPFEMVSP